MLIAAGRPMIGGKDEPRGAAADETPEPPPIEPPAKGAIEAPADGAPEAPADEGQKAASNETGGGGVRGAVKDWADAVTATLKAGFLLLAALAVTALVGSLVYREVSERNVTITVDKDTNDRLAELGANFDLGSMFVADLNNDIVGVTDVTRSLGISELTQIDADSGSFKALGVNVTTTDILGMLHATLGWQPTYAASLRLVCGSGTCKPDKPGKPVANSDEDEAGPEHKPLLLVVLHAGSRTRQMSFPVQQHNPGLRRGLEAAIQQAAAAMLELVDPVGASILYLNASNSLEPFERDQQRDWGRAAGAAFAARQKPGEHCFADLAFADSAWRREDLGGALQMLRAQHTATRNATCRVYTLTDQAILAMGQWFCWRAPAGRKGLLTVAAEAIGNPELDALTKTVPSERLRVISVRLQLRVLQMYAAMFAKHADGGYAATCDRGATLENADIAPHYAEFDAIVADLKKELKPGPDRDTLLAAHGVIATLTLLPRWVSASDPADCERLAGLIIKLIDLYLADDQTPRQLFMGRGVLLMAQARALASGEPAQRAAAVRAWYEAGVAFDNAANTRAASELAESGSDLEPRVLTGDAWLGAGVRDRASAAYSDALRVFIDKDEPIGDIRWLARAGGRWGALLIAEGACASSPKRREWDALWHRIGVRLDYDLCRLSGEWPSMSAGDRRRLGLLGLIYPLVDDMFAWCGWPGSQDDAMRLRCFDHVDAHPSPTAQSFFSGLSRRTLDEQINEALSPTPPP